MKGTKGMDAVYWLLVYDVTQCVGINLFFYVTKIWGEKQGRIEEKEFELYTLLKSCALNFSLLLKTMKFKIHMNLPQRLPLNMVVLK